ncbi:MAG: SCP2 sterol-binding domain-containing protein [Thermoplasmata archaeon]|nr:SCP2 sterol-binding domain-containing protein [Thermoplasmata archaeon]
MIELLEDIMNKFNKKVDENTQLFEKLKDINRTIQVELDENAFYHMRMLNGKIMEILPEAVKDPELPDLRILTDSDTFKGILNGTIKPLKAYAFHKIRFKGSLKDRLLLKDLLGGSKKKKRGK